MECVQLGHFENDYSFLLQGLQVDNCNIEMGHWLFDDKLRRFKNDYCLWLNCCQLPQSINLFFPTFLHSFQSSSWDDIFLLKEESFQTEKDLVLFDVRQFMVPFVTWLSQNCQAFQHDEIEHIPFITLLYRHRCDLIFLSRIVLFSHDQEISFMVTDA